MRFVFGLGLLFISGACGTLGHGVPDQTTASLDGATFADTVSFEAARRAMLEAEARAAAARLELEQARCRTKAEGIRAEVSRRLSSCERQTAEHNLCEARNSERRGGAAVAGCGVGIVLALLSAGAAAPLALGGCAGGLALGAGTNQTCAAVTCTTDPERAEATVLSERGEQHMPRCGGYVGFEVAAAPRTDDVVRSADGARQSSLIADLDSADARSQVQPPGVRVARVVYGSPAAGILEPGDVIHAIALTDSSSRRIGEREVRTLADLAAALEAQRVGQDVTFVVGRGAHRHYALLRLAPREGRSEL